MAQPLSVTVNISPASSNASFSANADSVGGLCDAGLSDKVEVIQDFSEVPAMCHCPIHPELAPQLSDFALSTEAVTPESIVSTDKIVPDSLATTPETELLLSSSTDHYQELRGGSFSDVGPLSINKLEIVIRDNDGSPALANQSPYNESRLDSLERKPLKSVSVTPSDGSSINVPSNADYQNLKFATVNTIYQEFETVTSVYIYS